MKSMLVGERLAILLGPPSKEEVKSQLRTGIPLPIAIGTILTLTTQKEKELQISLKLYQVEKSERKWNRKHKHQ